MIKDVITSEKIKVIEIQRSKGYSTRASLNIEKISSVIKFIKDIDKDIIIKKNISDTIQNLKMKQGVKNKDKWSWIVSDSLDKTDDELVDWFVKTITQFYNSFEVNN